jgi:hypothetical protein
VRNNASVPVSQDSPAACNLENLATRVCSAHAAIGRAAHNLLEHAMAAGDALLLARKQIAHGQWEPWLKRNCDLSPRTAERYVQLAKARVELEANPSRATDLSLAGALRLLGNGKKKARVVAQPTGKSAPPPLSSLTWAEATPEARTHFLNAIGRHPLLAAVPTAWDLQGLRTTPIETLLAELRRRPLTARQQKALRALTTTFTDSEPPTIDLEAIACADNAAKH